MGTGRTVRVGTRGSRLARAQTDGVIARLKDVHPGVAFEVRIIRTSGDDPAGRGISATGWFTREIEEALRAGEVDAAVHSLKDLPIEQPPGLVIGAVPEREDPRDALVGRSREDMREGIRVGTGSLRRAAQVRRLFPGCVVMDLRGNLDTRLRKVKEGVVDCAVLAAAGLRRLGLGGEISHWFDASEMLPAPGQGALAVEIRREDDFARGLVGTLHSTDTARGVAAERAFLKGLGGGCRVPVAALGTIRNGGLVLKGRVVSVDGSRVFEGERSGTPGQAEELGRQLAEAFLAEGAGDVIAQAEKA